MRYRIEIIRCITRQIQLVASRVAMGQVQSRSLTM